MSENLFPTSYKSSEEALKTASQIRRTCLIVNDDTGNWKILISNVLNRLQEDLSTIELSETESFIHINDSQGNISRNKVQLNNENTNYFAELISKFDSKDNVLTKDFSELPRRFKALITNLKQKDEDVIETQVVDRSGTFDIKTYEYICYFKNFLPLKSSIIQEVGNECYNSFILNLLLSDKKSIDAILPMIRKSKSNLEDFNSKNIMQLVSQGKKINMKFKLKEKVLERLKYIMFNNDTEQIMNMRSPLNKPVFTDLSNYTIQEINII